MKYTYLVHVNRTYMCRDYLMHSFVWVGPFDLDDLYDLQGLYNVDVLYKKNGGEICLVFIVALACRVG